MTTITENNVEGDVTVGVDTHRDSNVAAVLDAVGRVLGTAEFPTSPRGNRALVDWAETFGSIGQAGIEGTGSWGTSLCRHVTSRGVVCVEVNRANRQDRRRNGKSDVADAIGAARMVLSGQANGAPRGNNGPVEGLRVVRVGLRSANQSRTQAINQLHALRVTAPDRVRASVEGLSATMMTRKAAAWRPGDGVDDITVTKMVMKSLAQRILQLEDEIKILKARQKALLNQVAPAELIDMHGVGPSVASDLLITFGSNPHRIGSEAAFAGLCGVSPIDMSSGLHQHHRLNRGGDRYANSALHTIVLSRMSSHPPTKEFIARTVARGKTKKDAIRICKRSLARTIWRTLNRHQPPLDNP